MCPTLFQAKGTTSWSYTLRTPLPAGKYLAQVQAVDNLGNQPSPDLQWSATDDNNLPGLAALSAV